MKRILMLAVGLFVLFAGNNAYASDPTTIQTGRYLSTTCKVDIASGYTYYWTIGYNDGTQYWYPPSVGSTGRYIKCDQSFDIYGMPYYPINVDVQYFANPNSNLNQVPTQYPTYGSYPPYSATIVEPNFTPNTGVGLADWSTAWVGTSTASSSFIWQSFAMPHDNAYYFPAFEKATSTGLEGISDNIGNFFSLLGSWIGGAFRFIFDSVFAFFKWMFLPDTLPAFGDVSLENKIPFAYFTYVFSIKPNTTTNSQFTLHTPNFITGDEISLIPSWTTFFGTNVEGANLARNFLTTFVIMSMLGGLVALIRLT